VEPFGKIEEIFHEALRRDPPGRAGFVRQACGGDSELLRDVLSLLASHDDRRDPEPWAAEAAARVIDGAPSLQPGQSLGPYRIDSFLAAGGMGEIYRATDTRLGRNVAIKVARATFSERFDREARTIASLNHPHICQLYDIGPNYLVMELVDGSPLKGPLPLDTTLEYASQILDALSAAHRKGIAHRDLKPLNVLITRQGVKLLDFGLATGGAAVQSGDPALTTGLTAKGEILGTLQYMSPEQLQGKEVDARGDLFSFGCVLYEMVSGKRAFDGENAASVIAAILEREPAPLNVAPPLERVIKTCLVKDPDRRFQNAIDVKIALKWAVEQAPGPTDTRWARPAAIVAVLLAAAVGSGWAVSRFARTAADDHVIRFQISLPAGASINGGPFGGLAVSPDGQSVAFAADSNGQSGLWVRALDAESARLLPGTEDAKNPFWSPDGRSIAFSARSALQQIDLTRQRLSKICDVSAFNGGTWLDDGRIVFANRNEGIFQVAATGGVPAPVALLDPSRGDVTYAEPHALPGGRLLYTVQSPQSVDIYAGSFAKPPDRKLLVRDGRNAWLAHGPDNANYLMWLSGEKLLAQSLNLETAQLTGEPHVLTDHASVASSGAGTLLFGSSLAARQFEWVDRTGKAVGTIGQPNTFVFGRLSPDGRRVATIRSGANADIWVLETSRDVANRLTAGHGIHIDPVWSPDGRTILCSFGAPFNVFRIDADGAASEERVTQSPVNQYITDWSHDGRFIIFGQATGDTGYDLWTLQVTPEGKVARGATPKPYIRSPFDQGAARFSPDDRWVAYESNDSGQSEIYVQSFPDARDKIPISIGGGKNPEWDRAGRELYYVSNDHQLMAVALSVRGASLEASRPRELFPVSVGIAGAPYDVAPDGQRFLTSVARRTSQPLNVIVNWATLVKQPSAAQ
jgi:Tol biopolymer transport system component/predicted Ser/Thr protein kinase